MNEQIKTEREPVFSLEHWIKNKFEKDYNDQVRILRDLNLLEILPNVGEMGILGIDGKEYPIPTKEAIIAEIMKDREKYETKIKQGFVQIQLTPFASPLEKLTMTLEKCILKHFNDKKLFATKENLNDPDELLELNIEQPLFVWDGWIDPNAPQGAKGADVTGACVYYTDNFFNREGHGGKTKLKLLKDQANDPFIGWNVILLENNPNIPRKSKGKTVGGRKQIEANWPPVEYLEMLKTAKQYANEQGLTLEDWLIQFLTYLEKTNQVLDDYKGNGSACYLLASFNKFSRTLGCGSWDKSSNQVILGCEHWDDHDGPFGVRTAVPVRRGDNKK